MAQYIGITLGPIYETTQMTSSPAGLWAASSLFSWIAKELLENLCASDIPTDAFLSPAFSIAENGRLCLTSCEDIRKKGVGMLHDRIIYRGDDLKTVNAAINAMLDKLAENLAEMSKHFTVQAVRTWLKDYLHIYAVKKDIAMGENPILALGEVLDSLELEPGYVANEPVNYLQYLFESSTDAKNKNEQIHKSFLVRETDNWMLIGGKNGIRDLLDIANSINGKVQKKWQQYYAVLQADGDNMGKILTRLGAEPDEAKRNKGIREFSENCLKYCATAAQLVKDYGGMPIYAGGDDLLALVPIVGKDNKTLFGLISEISSAFQKQFKDEITNAKQTKSDVPAVSFGIAIQYVKSPLYEALGRAKEQLFENAKQASGKNALSLDLQKHSGQSLHILVSRMDDEETTSLDKLNTMIEQLMTAASDKEDKVEMFLSSAGYHIETFETLFIQAADSIDDTLMNNLFDNVFDNAGQKQYQDTYLADLKELAWQICLEGKRNSPTSEEKLQQLQAAIRLMHFMLEKKEAEE